MGVEIRERLGADPEEVFQHPVMLLSHACEFDDKPHVKVLQVCRVRPMSVQNPQDVGNIRAGAQKDTMYLGDVPTLGEMFADFRFWHRVLREDLDAARAQARCVASMTLDGRLSLQAHLYRFHTRRLLGEAPPNNPDDV